MVMAYGVQNSGVHQDEVAWRSRHFFHRDRMPSHNDLGLD